MQHLITRAAIILAAGFALGVLQSNANDVMAQPDTEPQHGPEVIPSLDNPNNPAVPGHVITSPSGQRGRMQQVPPQQPDATAQERSRCGMMIETLVRRRCLEELQRSRSE